MLWKTELYTQKLSQNWEKREKSRKHLAKGNKINNEMNVNEPRIDGRKKWDEKRSSVLDSPITSRYHSSCVLQREIALFSHLFFLKNCCDIRLLKRKRDMFLLSSHHKSHHLFSAVFSKELWHFSEDFVFSMFKFRNKLLLSFAVCCGFSSFLHQ